MARKNNPRYRWQIIRKADGKILFDGTRAAFEVLWPQLQQCICCGTEFEMHLTTSRKHKVGDISTEWKEAKAKKSLQRFGDTSLSFLKIVPRD